MKKMIIAGLMALLAIGAGFALGNRESLTWIEGETEIVSAGDGTLVLMLRLQDGTMVQVKADQGDLAKLQLRNRERIRIRGVYVGTPKGERTQAMIFARVMARNGKNQTLENPVQLQEQDRIRLREYEQDRLMTGKPEDSGSPEGSGGTKGAGAGTPTDGKAETSGR